MRKAIVIGINDYPNGAELYGCVRDAGAFRDVIRTHGDDSLNFTVEFYANVPTKDRLTELIHNLFQGKHEISLLYFSGHGAVNDVDAFLVTPDFRRYDPGVAMTHVMQMANDSQSDQRVIILDCCHSGAAGAPGSMGVQASILHDGVTILAASKANESSLEVNGKGVFTNLLLQAFEGGAADVCGNVTPGSIYSYIDQALGAFDQRPVFKTNITAFSPLRKVKPALPPEVLRKIADHFKDPLKELALDPSFEKTNSDKVVHRIVEPYALQDKVAIFQDLQQMAAVGLVAPVGTPHMYFAAMEGRSCRLTPLGMHYWRLVHEGRI